MAGEGRAGQLLEVERVPRWLHPQQPWDPHRARPAADGPVDGQAGDRGAVEATGALGLPDDPGGEPGTVVQPVGQSPQRDVAEDVDALRLAVPAERPVASPSQVSTGSDGNSCTPQDSVLRSQ